MADIKSVRINTPEYVLMKKFIEEHCGIHLKKDKAYLIESRLSDLVIETGCASFQEFHYLARTGAVQGLRDRIIDAMTTNETSWFRDAPVWEYIRDQAIPALFEAVERQGDARVWSAAASTGQEIYSLVMLLHEAAARGAPALLDRIEIMGADISQSAVDAATRGAYDALAMERGLPEEMIFRYFRREGDEWFFDPELKQRVRFFQFNLMNPFPFTRPFDLIFCRNVSIYFSDAFKKELFGKLAAALRPGGILLLGAAESLRDHSDDFHITYYNNAAVNQRK